MPNNIRVILIDSSTQQVTTAEHDNSLGSLHRLVGGYIEAGFEWPNGDVLYVDEEGLNKPQAGFFLLADRTDNWPMAGNGVIVGRELIGEDGDFDGNAAPTATVAEIAARVRFLTRTQFDSWSKANASDAAVVFTSWNPGEEPTTEVLRTVGQVGAAVPKVKP